MEHSHTHTHSIAERGQRKGRRLIDAVRLLGPHEEAATYVYWELFSDLLMVAAASSLAEVLEEEADFVGWLKFALLYVITVNGWLLYTHHYTARFDDSSLAHTIILFFYYLGMAGSIVNADFESYKGFSVSVLFQRIAFIVLMLPVAYYIPKASHCVAILVGWTSASSFMFLMAALGSEKYFVFWWIAGSVWEFFLEAAMVVYLQGDRLIKINIEHTKERLGVLVLVMLGESVITSTITYKTYAAEGPEGHQYYTVLALSFLLIFMCTLLFFNMQPAAKDHALRRSKFTGVMLLNLNKLLGLSLLTIGACIKLSVSCVVEDKALTPFLANALRLSVGTSLALLLAMRLCHYGGRIPRPEDPPRVRALFFAWWGVFGVAVATPFVLPVYSLDPAHALAWPSGLLLVLCVIESWFTHVLEDHLPSEEIVVHACSGRPSTLRRNGASLLACCCVLQRYILGTNYSF